MGNNPSAHFRRLGNENDTFDLICPHCFLTIGSGVKEPDIAELERAHWCWYRGRFLLIETATKHGEQDQ
jgi:hypothetical protein